ncbi:MAG: hypothetical protein J6Y04_07460, partial [Bacteroidaceae bacterium]|nr:hypothetical protein [Bacteroidaceae bacterium]
MKQRILFLLTCLLCTLALKGQPMTINSLSDMTQVTTVDDLNGKLADYYFVIADATGNFTMSHTSPLMILDGNVDNARYMRPQYQTFTNPFAVASQVWKITKDENDHYAFQSITDDYILMSSTTGHQNFVGPETEGNTKEYTISVSANIFKFNAVA